MKTGLSRYNNKQETINKRFEFNKNNYHKFIFHLHKTNDKGIIDYFMKASNKTQALRDLFK